MIRQTFPTIDRLIIIGHSDLDIDRAARIEWVRHRELTISRKMFFDAGDIAETIPIQQVMTGIVLGFGPGFADCGCAACPAINPDLDVFIGNVERNPMYGYPGST
jgi:hypothetical protein